MYKCYYYSSVHMFTSCIHSKQLFSKHSYLYNTVTTILLLHRKGYNYYLTIFIYLTPFTLILFTFTSHLCLLSISFTCLSTMSPLLYPPLGILTV